MKTQQRTLILGDIHGCYDELLDLFDAAALTDDDVVVSVGDLVDRGPKPAEVVEWFRQRPTEKSIVLMGNHERKHVRNVLSYSQEITRVQFPSPDAYADAVEWMKHLPYYWEIPGVVKVVHAALVPGVPLAEQDDAILSGTTSGEKKLAQLYPEGYWHERYNDDVPVVFGHHVTGPEPLVRDDGKVYGIDTGCCHGQRLTALSVPDFKLYSVPTRGGSDYWKQTMRDYQVPVLRTRAWPTMSWSKIKEELDDHRQNVHGGEATGYVEKIGEWSHGVQALIPKLLDRVPVLYEELALETTGGKTEGAAFAAALEAHPAKPLLFLLQRKKLTLDALKTRCTTPQTTLDLAKKLGVDTSSFVLP